MKQHRRSLTKHAFLSLVIATLGACGDVEETCEGSECAPTEDGARDYSAWVEGLSEYTSIDGSRADALALQACDPRACDELPGVDRLDTDLDGILDCAEGVADPDLDGLRNCEDLDSDGDGLLDADEGLVDPDADGVGAWLDEDSDGDGLLDVDEGTRDSDGDGVGNFLDSDSDDDGLSDAEEALCLGADYGCDYDQDLQPDYVDIDSDGDSVPDSDEQGCEAGSSDRHNADSDEDGFSDFVEVTLGSLPCDAESDIYTDTDIEYFFILEQGGDVQSATMEFNTSVRQADFFVNMDVTGSMGGEISSLRADLNDFVIPEVRNEVADTAWGVGAFADFPCVGGSSTDVPFELIQRVSTDENAVASSLLALQASGGGDLNETGIEAIFQIATGFGISVCSETDVLPFDPEAGLVEGVADGIIGGAGFREGAIPVIVHITDAPSHERGQDNYPYGHSMRDAVIASQEIGARVVGVYSGSQTSSTAEITRGDLDSLAYQTGARVPVCAWDESRPETCAPGGCCLGPDGATRQPDANEHCNLVFDISAQGAGLGDAMVSGLSALIKYAAFDVQTLTARDEAVFEERGIDTAQFIRAIAPTGFVLPEQSCSSEPLARDFDRDGQEDGYRDVTPGTTLTFEVLAENRLVGGTREPQVFEATILVSAGGASTLDEQRVVIVVPPVFKTLSRLN